MAQGEINESSIPKEAIDLLNQLPNKKLSLDFVIARGMSTSPTFKVLSSTLAAGEASFYGSRVIKDLRLSGSVSTFDDQLQPISPLSFSSSKITTGSLGISQWFSTGTSLSLSTETAKNQFSIPDFGDLSAYQTKSTIALSQSLWKDFLGGASRAQLRSGREQREASQVEFLASVEDWFLQWSELFYGAWLLQEQARAADDSLARRIRLASITKVKANRGTAEAPDVLQIESAVLNARAERDAALQSVSDVWRQVVIGIDLPVSFLGIDARLVPLEYSAPSEEALRLCMDTQDVTKLQDESAQVQSRRLHLKAAEAKLEAAKAMAGPDLRFQASYSTNGVDPSLSPTWSTMFSADHPAYSLGLTFSMPLGFSEEKAAIAGAHAEHIARTAGFAMASDQFQVDWLNTCAEFRRQLERRSLFEQAYKNHLQRVELEERRFAVGRTQMFQVITAGDEAMASKIALAVTDVAKAQAAWKVMRLGGKIAEKFKEPLSQLGNSQ